MVLRTARQGGRAGQQFYGCSKYPRCKGTTSKGSSTAKAASRRSKSATSSTRSTQPQPRPERSAVVTPPKPVDHALRQKIETAVKGWVENLVDFTRNNNLLYYRDTKTTTLELEHADPEVLAELLAGESVSFRDLFRRLDLMGADGETVRRDIDARIKKIRSKAQENYEERSIGTLSLAHGFATWTAPMEDDSSGRPPKAPVFIYGLEIRPGRRRDDLTVVVSGEPEINPVLQIFLKKEFGIEVISPDLGASDSETDVSANTFAVFREKWAEVPGLQITDTSVISNFSYAKLSMVQDLESGLDDLSNHPLVLALAGDAAAQQQVRDQVTDIDLSLPNRVAPANEFLVLDADSSQNEVINAMVAGQSFAFEGPPGTGKSQTIANSIACLIAEGKKVLFVAEKRAAIDAVVRRLSSVGLADLVMNFHGTGKKRRDVLDELAQTLSSVRAVPQNVNSNNFDSLVDARSKLLKHNDELFQVHQPWGVSLYDVLQVGASLKSDRETAFLLRDVNLRQITPDVLQELESKLSQFERLGGFVRSRGAETWRTSSIKSSDDVARIVGALRDLKSGGLDRYQNACVSALEVLGVTSIDEATTSKLAQVLSEVNEIQNQYGDESCASNRDSLYVEVGTKSNPLRMRLSMLTSPSYRKAVRELRQNLGRHYSLRELRDIAVKVKTIKSEWLDLVPSSLELPVIARSISLQDLVNSWKHVQAIKNDLNGVTSVTTALAQNPDEAIEMVSELLETEQVGRGMLECASLRRELEQFGLGPLLAELQHSESVTDPGERLRWAWSRSLASHLRSSSATLNTLSHKDLDAAVQTFASEDIRHIEGKPQQIRSRWAQRFLSVQSSHPKQEQSLLASINRKRKLPGLSRVFSESPDLISALKPCWVMSPLSVSMLRPPTSWFDVVIFDEASQIPPADAITSIKAAKQMVVAGDSLQLPPTPFFAAGDTQTDDPYEDEQYEETSKSADYESILDFVKFIIPKYRQLRWHYRSRDERLIAFSNFKLYKTLIAFPYAEADTTLRHVVIPQSERSKGTGASNPAEVERVVQLVTEHVETHPEESLGVIALGLKHSVAIEDALANERLVNQALDSFMNNEQDGEPFFVKNLERVQGDERDAIILSVGYGRGEAGQVKYTFGPILGAKGERRLNVATTRAKLRMTTVAAFSSRDLDISKTTKGGAAFLREYLAFAESGGTELPDKGSTRVEMNPFEQSVFDQLSRRGVMLVPQYGVGNYRLDFAVQNPEKPGSFVLAIECDGRSYHSYPTARERDRLREAALRQRGWEFHRIWSDHWFANPEAEVERALIAIESGLSKA